LYVVDPISQQTHTKKQDQFLCLPSRIFNLQITTFRTNILASSLLQLAMLTLGTIGAGTYLSMGGSKPTPAAAVKTTGGSEEETFIA